MALHDIILARQESLERERRYYEPLWDDITLMVNPRREGVHGDDTDELPGQKRGKRAYDGTPGGALSIWTAGIIGSMVSRSVRWFRTSTSFRPLDDNDEVRQWLQAMDEHMFNVFGRSNFYTQLVPWVSDAGSIGTATLFTVEDKKRKVPVSTAIHPREVFISENEFGIVDTVHRKFKISARQAVEMFADNKHGNTGKLSETIIKAAEKTPNQQFKFIHAVYPNTDRNINKFNSTNKPFRSIYIQTEGSGPEGEKIVRDSGFDFNPYAVWRLRKNSNESYGYSQAADSIIEITTLNLMAKDMNMASNLSVRPPYNVPEEMKGEVNITPNGINYYRDANRVASPVALGINYPIGLDMLDRLKESIESKYGIQYFKTFIDRTGEATAFEIQQIKSEQSQLIGPQIDSLENEALRQSFETYLAIEDRAGRLPATPDILLDEDYLESIGAGNLELKVDFVGPLSQAQKLLFTVFPVRDGLANLAPLAEIDPSVLDRINTQQLAEDILKATNFPQSALRSDEEVEEIQAQRAQQQAMAQAMQAAESVGKVLPAATAPVDETSLLANAG